MKLILTFLEKLSVGCVGDVDDYMKDNIELNWSMVLIYSILTFVVDILNRDTSDSETLRSTWPLECTETLPPGKGQPAGSDTGHRWSMGEWRRLCE